MKAFLTGATGFVGGNLIRLLLTQGYQVKALVRSSSSLTNLHGLDVEIVYGDLNDPDLSRLMSDCQILFHVAACYSLWQRDRQNLWQSNVLGTRNILQSAQKAGIERLVYTSSVAAIGVGEAGQTVDETHQSPVAKLIGNYKKSKYYAELEAIAAFKNGQDIVIVNPATPIGSRDIKPTPTGEIVVRFLKGQMPFYTHTGLNLIDVDDVAWGHLLALEKGKSGDRYILGNQNLTLKQILDELGNITGLPTPKYAIPHFIPYLAAWFDEIALSALGKTPTIALEGVKMAQQNMFYSSKKAITQLGLPQSSVNQALRNAVTWHQRKIKEFSEQK